jgi:hypothetical protein
VTLPAYRSPCLWRAGHVQLRALANGTARNRRGPCVSLVPRAGVAALVALLVTSHKSPANMLHVVSRVGPNNLESINMMACKCRVTPLFLALVHLDPPHRLDAISCPFILTHTDCFP